MITSCISSGLAALQAAASEGLQWRFAPPAAMIAPLACPSAAVSSCDTVLQSYAKNMGLYGECSSAAFPCCWTPVGQLKVLQLLTVLAGSCR